MCACSLSHTYTHECTHAARYMIPTHANRNKHTLTRPKLTSYTNLQPCCPAPMCPALNVLAQRAEAGRGEGGRSLGLITSLQEGQPSRTSWPSVQSPGCC